MLCFRKFPVAKKFMDKGGGEFQDFLLKKVCLTVPIFSDKGGILYCCNTFGYGKSFDKRGGGSIKIFSRKTFVSQCRNFSLGNLVFHYFWVLKKFG